MIKRRSKYMCLYLPVILVLILFSSLLSFSCIQKEVANKAQSERLFGKWKWVESSGGFAGEAISPITQRCERSVEYCRKGIYKTYKNGKKETQIKFKFKEGKSIYSDKPQQLIEYADGHIHSFKFFGNDTLYINEECMDCYSHTYIREK